MTGHDKDIKEQYVVLIEMTFFIDKKGERMYLTIPRNGEIAIESVTGPQLSYLSFN